MRQPAGYVKSMTPAERKAYRTAVARRSYEKHLAKIQAKREANRESAKAYARDYREKNREQVLAGKRAYSQKPEVRAKRKISEQRVEVKAQKAAWHKKTWELRREVVAAKHAEWSRRTKWQLNRHHERWATDPDYKIKCVLRNRLRDAVRGNFHSGIAVDLLGCTVAHLRIHLESQFQPGMTWANRGLRGWHIDHIKALANFNLTDPVQLAEACHYTNLQPLWATENIRKGAKAA